MWARRPCKTPTRRPGRRTSDPTRPGCPPGGTRAVLIPGFPVPGQRPAVAAWSGHDRTSGARGARKPIVGSLDSLRDDPLRAYEEARRRYGDVVLLTGGPPGMKVNMYAVF